MSMTTDEQEVAVAKDSRLRSVYKSLSWRVCATLTTAIIAYAITGSLDMAALIGGIEFFVKIGLFYAHERGWLLLPGS